MTFMRAAVFAVLLVGCESKKKAPPPPTPAPASEGSGDGSAAPQADAPLRKKTRPDGTTSGEPETVPTGSPAEEPARGGGLDNYREKFKPSHPPEKAR